MSICISVVFFTRNETSRKKEHAKLGNICKKHGYHLSVKLMKSSWLLAIFELMITKNDSIQKALNQNNE